MLQHPRIRGPACSEPCGLGFLDSSRCRSFCWELASERTTSHQRTESSQIGLKWTAARSCRRPDVTPCWLGWESGWGVACRLWIWGPSSELSRYFRSSCSVQWKHLWCKLWAAFWRTVRPSECHLPLISLETCQQGLRAGWRRSWEICHTSSGIETAGEFAKDYWGRILCGKPSWPESCFKSSKLYPELRHLGVNICHDIHLININVPVVSTIRTICSNA